MATSIVKCFKCGISFAKENKLINLTNKKGQHHYCSKECQNSRYGDNITTKCAECGTLLVRRPCDISESKTGLFFCNKSCAAKHNNSIYKVKEGQYIDYRDRAFDIYDASCKICGFNQKYALQVHHIDHNRDNNSIENLMILCANCHLGVHKGIFIIG